MAAALLPGQSYPGEWIPPGEGYIWLFTIGPEGTSSFIPDDPRRAPFLAFCIPPNTGLIGGGVSRTYTFEDLGGITITFPGVGWYGMGHPSNVSWDMYVIPNNAENNANFRHIAGEPEYVLISKEYRVDKKSNTLIPGIGVVYGDYYLTGGISLEGNTLFVSGHGTRHTPTYDGVTFWMTATVLIDGKVFAKEALKRSGGHELVPEHGIPIGSTTFSLPEPTYGQKTQLLLEGSFNISNLEGNASMPSATFAQTIDIQPKQKQK